MKLKTMADVKRANQRAGFHFFDCAAMQFFDSRVESMLLLGKYFVTSEQFDADSPRLYSIREALADGSIKTVGEFQGYTSRTSATAAIFLIPTVGGAL